MTYQMTYNDGAGTQVRQQEPDERRALVPFVQRERRFRVPGIAKTAATFMTGAALFFGLEAYAPDAFRPSTLMGGYESRVNAQVQSAVKAAELEQQARYEVWAANVKVSVEQQAEQYKAVNQAIIARYQATFDRGKIWADAAARIQGQYVAARMSQTQSTQGTDVAIINWTRMFGRAANALDPGSGNDALAYANNLSRELSGELTDAATKGVTISVEGWDTGLASVDDLRREFGALRPITIPPPPRLTGDAVRTPEGKR